MTIIYSAYAMYKSIGKRIAKIIKFSIAAQTRIDPLRDGEIFMGDKWQPQEPRGCLSGDVPAGFSRKGVLLLVIYGDFL